MSRKDAKVGVQRILCSYISGYRDNDVNWRLTSKATLHLARESFESANAFFCCFVVEEKCSFNGIVEGSCTYERRDRAKNTEVIPLLHCN